MKYICWSLCVGAFIGCVSLWAGVFRIIWIEHSWGIGAKLSMSGVLWFGLPMLIVFWKLMCDAIWHLDKPIRIQI